MKITSFIVVALVFVLSCQTDNSVEPPLPPTQTKFDNLVNCCKGGDCSKDPQWASLYDDIYEVKNVTGRIIVTTSPFQSDLHTWYITSDSIANIKLEEPRFNDWRSYRWTLLPCNLPEKLKQSTKDLKIRFDCKILSPVLRINDVIIDVAGYPIELKKIEIID